MALLSGTLVREVDPAVLSISPAADHVSQEGVSKPIIVKKRINNEPPEQPFRPPNERFGDPVSALGSQAQIPLDPSQVISPPCPHACWRYVSEATIYVSQSFGQRTTVQQQNLLPDQGLSGFQMSSLPQRASEEQHVQQSLPLQTAGQAQETQQEYAEVSLPPETAATAASHLGIDTPILNRFTLQEPLKPESDALPSDSMAEQDAGTAPSLSQPIDTPKIKVVRDLLLAILLSVMCSVEILWWSRGSSL